MGYVFILHWKMSKQNLEQRIGIKFCVEFGKHASEIVQCTLEHMAQKQWRNQEFSVGISGSKKVSRMGKTLNKVGDWKRTDTMKMLKSAESCVFRQGQVVSQVYCLELQIRLCEVVHRKRPEVWHSKWFLHHDNTLAHLVLPVQQFKGNMSVVGLEHPPCLSGLASSDFWLYPKLISTLKGWKFQDIMDVQQNVMAVLKVHRNIPDKIIEGTL